VNKLLTRYPVSINGTLNAAAIEKHDSEIQSLLEASNFLIFKNEVEQSPIHIKNANKALKLLDDESLVKYMFVEMIIPEDLSGDLVKYMNLVLTQGLDYVKLVSDSLDDVISLTKALVSNKADTRQLTGTLKSHDKELHNRLKDLRKIYTSYFKTHTGINHAQIGDMINNMDDLDDVLHYGSTITILDDKHRLMDIVKKTSTLNDIIINDLDVKEYPTKTVKQLISVVKTLANCTKNVGELGYRHNVLVGISRRLAEGIIKNKGRLTWIY